MRNYLRLGIDVVCVALAALLAVFIRENFAPSAPKLQAIIPYVLFSVASAAVVFTLARLHRTVWRYTSLLDVLHLLTAVTIALLLALLTGFAFNRFEDVSRALPVIHWLVLVVAMIGIRTAARLWRERGDKLRTAVDAPAPTRHVLLVGINDLTELYLASASEFAPANLTVVGILSRGRGLHGRLMRQYKILGAPEDISRVLAELELHGITIDRIIVMQLFEQLSKTAQEALLEVERASAIRVEWFLETLGWHASPLVPQISPRILAEAGRQSVPDSDMLVPHRKYARFKRAIDFTSVIFIVFALSPLLALVALLVAVDVGFPVVFWQQRPGRHGRPFKLYKFRTMRQAHDAQGNRITDQLRFSGIGNFLRRSRLDELPQLYNVLVSEMSLVGPRPLLPVDQPQGEMPRLLVRPGLTGWAQVNGGREISNEDKAALDLWYIKNASLWLDIKILLRTLAIVIAGDRVNAMAVEAAQASLEEMRTKPTVNPGSASSRIDPSVAQTASAA